MEQSYRSPTHSLPTQDSLARSLPTRIAHPHSQWIERCAIAALVVGVLVRLIQYASNRSLWGDEASLALNLIERSYGELLGALDYNQAAPPLFLWIEKFAIDTLGNNEYAMRLYPLIGGVLSVFLFYRFTKIYTAGWARAVAMFLFAMQSYIVYFAGETKPYGWDVSIGLTLFMAIAPLATITPRIRSLLTAGLLGGVSIWLSFPSILVIAAVESANLLSLKVWQLKVNAWRSLLIRRLPLYAVWIANVVALYIVNVSKTLSETNLSASWDRRYPDNWVDIFWLFNALDRFFHEPLGFPVPFDIVAMLPFVVGLVYLYRTQKWRLLYIGSPIVVAIVAAYLHKYPFRHRLILFLVPYGLIILSEGIVLLIRHWRKGPKKIGRLGWLLAVLLLVQPAVQTLSWAVQPERAHFDAVRPALAHIQENWQPGDKLYVSHKPQRIFMYYQSRFSFSPDDVVFTELKNVRSSTLAGDGLAQFQQAFDQEVIQLKNAAQQNAAQQSASEGPTANEPVRVWFLLIARDRRSEEVMLQAIDQQGVAIERSRYPSVVVSLRQLD